VSSTRVRCSINVIARASCMETRLDHRRSACSNFINKVRSRPGMTPMLFILLAPPSVGFISYIGMVGELDVFARIIYYMALFLGLLLAMNIFRFLKVPFFISSWAYSFPLAALTIATMKMTHLTSYIFFQALSGVLLFLLTVLLSWLVVRTIKAVFDAELCRPE
ncbi:SLAC1 family transporter, partial [Aeromonas caviae]|nr:hypothetical protein [Aeromonas caviae]